MTQGPFSELILTSFHLEEIQPGKSMPLPWRGLDLKEAAEPGNISSTETCPPLPYSGLSFDLARNPVQRQNKRGTGDVLTSGKLSEQRLPLGRKDISAHSCHELSRLSRSYEVQQWEPQLVACVRIPYHRPSPTPCSWVSADVLYDVIMLPPWRYSRRKF